MKRVFQLQPMALAISSALTVIGNPLHAQGFDPNSAAVRQAYTGIATQEKKDAALDGLVQLANQVRCTQFCNISGGGGSASVIITVGGGGAFGFTFSPVISTVIQPANDGDLGVPGAAITLNNTLLRTLASFSTARNVFVGTGGAVIDTNGFDLSVSGNLTANGTLAKYGLGTLSLTGNNSWDTQPYVERGVLEGSHTSLQTSIFIGDGATVRFKQGSDGTYAGVLTGADRFAHGNLEKTGSGTLTLSNTQSFNGTTSILGGTLALRGFGSLGDNRALNIGAGSTFDISGSAINIHQAGRLAGGGNIELGANRIIASADTDSTFSGSISGSGGLNKAGSGTLILSGLNTYTGATNIADGTLALTGQGSLNPASSLTIAAGTFDISGSIGSREVGSISGSGLSNIRLGSNTLTVGSDNSSQIFTGIIAGSGGITKTGSGDLTLDLRSTYTGATTINQGNLIATAQSISDSVVNNAKLTLAEVKGISAPFISAYSGTISGSGQLVKSGDGLIWLRGRNTYTGGTEVNDGVLIGNTDSLQGNITNHAALGFYQVDNSTYAGNLSGSGVLLQYGPGVLTLTGNNSYSGGTAISGTLRVSRDANLGAANGSLLLGGGTLQIAADMTTARNITLAPAGGTFDTSGNLTVNGNISGPGALAKTGAGALTLNGANSYAGATTVNAGRLEVNGSINSRLLIAAGAELGGSGLISGDAIVNRGRLSRGSGIGDIRVAGNVSFEAGSVFTVKANAAGESDRLLVAATPGQSAASGRVAINGGTVEVLAGSGDYRRETRYTIVTAARGVGGQFTGVTSNFAFLNPGLAYDANNVYLTLARNDLNYAAVAQNPDQSAVAQGLTRMTGATGDAETVIAALDGLSAAQARAAFDSIGAAGRAALTQSGLYNQRAVNQNLIARLGIAEGGGTMAPATGVAGRGLQIAFEDGVRNDAAPVYAQAGLRAGGQGLRAAADPNNGFWLRGYGGTGHLDGDATAPGAKYHYGGTLFGYDRKVGDTLRLGVFGGYAEPRFTQDVATSSARTRTGQLGAYGRLHGGTWHVDAVASYARNDTRTSRVVSVGTLSRAASGSFTGDTLSVQLETGYTIKTSAFEVQPLAGLSWVRQTQNAYSETGAGALNLVLPGQSRESLRSSLGVRTLHPFQAGATHAVFETRAAWSHEFNATRNIDAYLAGDPAAAVFTVSGPSLPRDSAVVGVGIAAQASRSLRLYADLNGEFNGRVRAGALSVGLRYQW